MPGTIGEYRQGVYPLRFVADKEYEPVRAIVQQAGVPTGPFVQIDVLDDGVSIFDTPPTLTTNQDSSEHSVFRSTYRTLTVENAALSGTELEVRATTGNIEQDSVITLNVLVAGGGTDLTVHLELDEA